MPTLRDLDRLIERRHLLKHPFYTAWSHGTVPLSTLQAYAGAYYEFERNFPRYVAATYAKLTVPSDRRVLLENLVDEEGRSPTHPELWRDFASALGTHLPESGSARLARPAAGLCRTYEQLTGGRSAAGALAALYAYEAQFPKVAAEKSRGLAAHYGIQDAAAHEFFRVHTLADVEHAKAERALLARQLRGSSGGHAIAMRAAERTLDAWWQFLDRFN
ncbi:MAG: iron-containing redox enzyme family protein [Thermoplasmata archaeon]|nr:iron-containing redox enzyme family protein [Thermoplasmata archaeon]MCI4341576.1 iron-containing redox enzyme family protein [Thermoplasmata archaeon]